MKILNLLLILATLITACEEDSISKDSDKADNQNSKNWNTNGLELPKTSENHEVIKYSHYTVSYKETYELANWVAYELTKDELNGEIERTDNFRPDSNVSTGTATVEDYKGSGYDRGHLMPAADCTFDEIAMSESFYFTNIAPQVSGLNRGEWKTLEEDFRNLAMEHDTIWVVTGPIFDEIIEYIGENEVAVPMYYYKAGIYKVDGEYEAETYILPNTAIDNDIPMSDFRISVDSLENRIGYDLFYQLPDEIENEVED